MILRQVESLNALLIIPAVVLVNFLTIGIHFIVNISEVGLFEMIENKIVLFNTLRMDD